MTFLHRCDFKKMTSLTAGLGLATQPHLLNGNTIEAAEITALRRELARSIDKNCELENQIGKCQKDAVIKLRVKEDLLMKLHAEVKTKSMMENSAKAEITELRRQVGGLTERLQVASNSHVTFEAKVVDLQQQAILESGERDTRYQQDMQQLRDEKLETERENSAKIRHLELSHQTEHDTLLEKFQILSVTHKNLLEQNESSAREHAAAREQQQQHYQLVQAQLDDKVSILQQEYDNLQEKHRQQVEAYNRLVDHKGIESTEAAARDRDYQVQLEGLEMDNKLLQERITKASVDAQESMDLQQTQIVVAAAQLQSSERDHHHNQLKITELSAVLLELQSELAQAKENEQNIRTADSITVANLEDKIAQLTREEAAQSMKTLEAHQKEMDRLREKHENIISILRTESGELRDKVMRERREAEDQIATLSEEVENLRVHMRSEESLLSQLTRERTAHRDELASSLKKLRSAQDQVAHLDSERIQQEVQIARIRSQEADLQQEYGLLKEQFQRINSLLESERVAHSDSLNSVGKSGRDTVRSLEIEKDRLLKELSSATLKLSEAERLWNEINEQADRVMQQLTEERSQNKRDSAMRSSEWGQKEQLLTRENSKLQSDLTDLQTDRDLVEQENRNRIHDMQQTIEQERHRYEKQLGSLKDAHNKTLLDGDAASEKISAYLEELEQFKVGQSEKALQIERDAATITRLTNALDKERSLRSAECGQAASGASSLSSEILTLNNQVTDLESQVKNLGDQNAALEQQVASERGSHKSLMEQLHSEKANENSKCTALQGQLSKSEWDRENEKSNYAFLERAMAEEKRQKEIFQEDNERLKEEKNDARATHDKMQEELISLQDELIACAKEDHEKSTTLTTLNNEAAHLRELAATIPALQDNVRRADDERSLLRSCLSIAQQKSLELVSNLREMASENEGLRQGLQNQESEITEIAEHAIATALSPVEPYATSGV